MGVSLCSPGLRLLCTLGYLETLRDPWVSASLPAQLPLVYPRRLGGKGIVKDPKVSFNSHLLDKTYLDVYILF